MQQLTHTDGLYRHSTSPSPWLSTEAAAAYLGYEPGTLKTWRCTGHGPRYRVINHKFVRYLQADLDAFMRGEDMDAPRLIAATK